MNRALSLCRNKYQMLTKWYGGGCSLVVEQKTTAAKRTPKIITSAQTGNSPSIRYRPSGDIQMDYDEGRLGGGSVLSVLCQV